MRIFIGVACWAAVAASLALGGIPAPDVAGMLPLAVLVIAGSYLVFFAGGTKPLADPLPRVEPVSVPKTSVAAVVPPQGASRADLGEAEVVSFLGALQQKGRFIDFVMDDITTYADAQVGAAARIVHQGCQSVIKEYFDIVPVQAAREGGPVTLESNYDPGRHRLVGKVVGKPPFRGIVVHRGWMAARVSLPKLVAQEGPRSDIIAPAEIELS